MATDAPPYADELSGYIRFGWPVTPAAVRSGREDLEKLLAIGATVIVRGIKSGTTWVGADDPREGEVVHAITDWPVPLCLQAALKEGKTEAEWPAGLKGNGFVAVSDHGRVSCTDCLGWLHS